MDASSTLIEVLGEAQVRGVIGPGPLEVHIAHALDFAGPDWPSAGLAVDLGSGGGLPGLPLALAHPALRWVLIDAWAGRAAALDRSIMRLGLSERVEVRHERAEDAGRSGLRGQATIVVARGFGPPGVVAECAAPLLALGGHLVVSDAGATGEGPPRWPATGLAEVGLVESGTWETSHGRYRQFDQQQRCPLRYPRRPAAVARRPIF